MRGRAPERPPRVVVVGGGFAGLHAVKALRRAPVEVLLIDRTNHHLFQPLLYQVATAGLSPSDIARPLRAIFRRQRNAAVLMAQVRSLRPAERQVILRRGDAVPYDWLILAIGSRHSYFGHGDWEQEAPGLKTLDDALAIREKVLISFERAERAAARGQEVDPGYLTFVVVGGGPTGVEMAGAIAEIARETLRRNFRFIDPKRTRVHLVEAMGFLLPPYPEELRESARRQLEDLGVEVQLETTVVGIDAEGVDLERRPVAHTGEQAGAPAAPARERIATYNVIWAAGNEVPPLLADLGTERDRQGRAVVGPDLSIAGRPEVFVIGDASRFEQDGAALPGLAPVAKQQGRHAARCIVADLRGKPRPRFRYVDRGTMATIGKARAVAWIHRLRYSGLLAWLTWSLVHVLFLIGFRNRLSVMIEWSYLFFTGQRGARLLYGQSLRRMEDG